MEKLVEVEDLSVSYYSYRGVVHALNGVSLEVGQQETIGLVGETGSGKSTIGLAIVGLIPNPGRVDGGKISIDGEDLSGKSKDQMREFRRTKLALIFQDPSTALNPVLRIGDQLAEAFAAKRGISRKEAKKMAVDILAEVGISNPKVANQYPHELSGGMKQRVMIGMALTGNPELLIADEPTSSLDVTLQAQIMELLADVSKKKQMAVLLITHNIGVVSRYCERVAVMYAGNIVETGTTRNVLKFPAHPYTQGLLSAVKLGTRKQLTSIPGTVPDLINLIPGCPFAPRCSRVMDVCSKVKPRLTKVKDDQYAACHLYEGAMPA
ncbi:MAG: ABC transporter ATP-binding protein [Thaumarchaeota archaeon]|nr:ABC transporter ATP-binding protein [Nitrososphaerota archaeon]